VNTAFYVLIIIGVVAGIIYFTPLRTLQIPGMGAVENLIHTVDQTIASLGAAKKSIVNAPSTIENQATRTGEISLNALSESASALQSGIREKAANLLDLKNSSSSNVISQGNTHGFEMCAALKRNENITYEIQNPAIPQKQFTVHVLWGDGKANTIYAQQNDKKVSASHIYDTAGTYTNTFTITNASGTTVFERNLCIE
jgi:PKD repeat protein